MARLEYDEGDRIRFIELSVRGPSHEKRTGSFSYEESPRASETHIAFADEEEAWRKYDELIVERVSEGYRLVGDIEGELPTLDEAERATQISELETLIRRDPSADGTCLVFGDWLLNRSAPRAAEHGELVAVQTKLELTPHDPTLREAERRLLAICGAPRMNLTWRRGFIRSIDLPRPTEHSMRMQKKARVDSESVAEDLETLLGLPIARLVERLAIHPCASITANHQPIIDALLRAKPERLRELVFASFEPGRERVMSWVQLGDVSAMWSTLSGLHDVTLSGVSVVLGTIDAPELRRFTLRSSGLAAESARAIACAKWPHLQSLEVWFGSSFFVEDVARLYQFEPIRLASLDDIRLLLDAPPPQLEHLALRNAEFTDDLCAALATSRVLPRLRSLDLSMGTMSDEGARTLVQHARAFGHLTRLDVSDNVLSAPAVESLHDVCPGLVAGAQRRADPDGARYVSLIE